MNTIYVALIAALPLLSFLLTGIFGKSLPARVSGFFGTLMLGISATLSIMVAWNYFFVTGLTDGRYQAIYPFIVNWLSFSDSLSVQMGAILDPISVMMLVVVTLVSFMVHLYSMGYMKGEKRFPAYYSFLGLFTFSMLMLVLSVNILQLYIFWELVGISSYLLISFYYDRPSAVAAAKKAFIVTRFADMFFLIGVLLLSWQGGSLDIATLIANLTKPDNLASPVFGSFIGLSGLTWAMMLIFIGGLGKSAMFPLHIWLPDAMEGPTPVSALIHAATMVVAGVYLVARLFPIYSIATPQLLEAIGYIGAFTAIFAALIACTQFDIKRVLAYSTMSQIGFMLFALGVAGWSADKGEGFTASMFHLFTHAMFKALLFLGAGSIIHSVHSNDMRDMGGLRRQMPFTHFAFLIACIAIAGVPPFAGYFSKEMILASAYENNKLIFITGFLTSGLTAFYMFRLYFSIFWRDKATEAHEEKHAHSDWSMWLPLLFLSIGAIAAGWIPFTKLVTYNGEPIENHTNLWLTLPVLALILLGILIATLLYRTSNARPQKIVEAIKPFHILLIRKFYIDDIYMFVTKNIIFKMVSAPAAWFDRNVINGTVNAVGATTVVISRNIKSIQSGKLQSYMLYFIAGLLLLAVLLIYFIK